MASPIPPGSPSGAAEETKVSDVYRAYVALAALARTLGHADLGHQLVLCRPLSVAGEAPMVAAGIASAGSLSIEPDPAAIRHSIRSGAIDFAVNTLDEALRALKNELRKGLSIAICLQGNPATVRAEMEERGVQPDILCSPESEALSAKFLERGAHTVDLERPQPAAFSQGLVEMSWWAAAQPGKWLPRLDDLVAACLPPEDWVRRTWIKRAPRYLGRALRTRRYLPMTSNEAKLCVEALRQQTQEESWQGIEAQIAPIDSRFESSHRSQTIDPANAS